MRLLGKRIKDVTIDDIQRLIDNEVAESMTIEYKAELKIDKGEERKEFLADITSFTNTEGGVIIYGIAEKKDSNHQNLGIPDRLTPIESENTEKLIQAIESIAKDGVEPKIGNLAVHTIQHQGGYLLLIGISKSIGLPHMVTIKRTNKFYKRSNSGKYLVDVYELQTLYNQSISNKQEAERFRIRRINEVKNNQFLPNVDSGPTLFFHVIPTNFLVNEIDLTNTDTIDLIVKELKPIQHHGWDFFLNIEGICTFNDLEEGIIKSYTQFFRNGMVEFFTTKLFHFKNSKNKIFIEGQMIEIEAIRALNNVLKVYNSLNIDYPFIVFFSFAGIRPATIYGGNLADRPRIIHKDELLTPPVLITDNSQSIDQQLKPLFDIMWQSGNFTKSPYYDDNGNRRN